MAKSPAQLARQSEGQRGPADPQLKNDMAFCGFPYSH
jgi:hypothetical protein